MFNTIDDIPKTSHNGAIFPGSPQIYQLRIDCMANKTLTAAEDDLLTVEARLLGDTDWTNLQSSSIDLDVFAGTRQTFEFRISAAAVTKTTSASADLHIR